MPSEADRECRADALAVEPSIGSGLQCLMPSGYAGRQLYGMLRRQGLTDLTIEVHPLHSTSYAFTRQAAVFDETEAAALAAGAVSELQLREWRRSLEQGDAAGAFFSTLSQVMVSGRKP